MKTQAQQTQGFVAGPNLAPNPAPPLIVQPPPPQTGCRRVDRYQHRQSTGLGVMLILFGVAAIVLNGVGFAVSDELANVSHGFYCGVMFILTGSFGCAAACKNKCMIITFMVLAIITSVLTIELLTVGLVGAVQNGQYCGDSPDNYGYCPTQYYGPYGYYVDCMTVYRPPCKKGAIAVEALLAILALAAAIVSIWGSAICCRAVCCCSQQPSYGMVVPMNYGNPQVMVISQQSSSNFAYGSGQRQAVTGYCMYNPATQQYQYNYWATPTQFQAQPPYPIGAQAVPDTMASTAIGMPMAMAPPGYAETLHAAGPSADDKK